MQKLKSIFMFASLLGSYLCVSSVSQAYSQIGFTDDYNIWQAVIAAIAGGVLTSSSLFFFIRRIINQYDLKHEQHEKDLESMQKTISQVESHFKKGLSESTDLIMTALNSLKDDIREIITDVAILKDDRKRCVNINDRVDNNAGGIKVLGVQFESLMGALTRLERQMEKQIQVKK